jgi:hypothetical protein
LSSESILKGVIDFWQKIVYAKPKFQEWHALDCIKGKCPNVVVVTNDAQDSASF